MGRVLVVDDSVSVLEAVAGMLENAGHEVFKATSGRRAVRLLQDQTLELLITDIFMPDLDGLELIREARKISARMPVVAMSAVTGEMCMLTVAQRLGACCVLKKPCSRAELNEIVTAALRMPCSALRESQPGIRAGTAQFWPSCSHCSVAGAGARRL